MDNAIEVEAGIDAFSQAEMLAALKTFISTNIAIAASALRWCMSTTTEDIPVFPAVLEGFRRLATLSLAQQNDGSWHARPGSTFAKLSPSRKMLLVLILATAAKPL
jgi:hypothetical protein